MIQKNDLRIGNLVQYDDGTKVIVDSIYHNDIGVEGFPQPLSLTVILPIPLTPEILEKAGWKWLTEGQYYYPPFIKEIQNFSMILWQDDEGCFCFSIYDMLTKRVPYVHTLQNLFHSLTGQELNIDL